MPEVSQEDADRFMSGMFIVRDTRGNIVDKITSTVVKVSDEMEGADPLWFRRREPGYEAELEEAERLRVQRAEERSRRRIREIESAGYDPDFPF